MPGTTPYRLRVSAAGLSRRAFAPIGQVLHLSPDAFGAERERVVAVVTGRLTEDGEVTYGLEPGDTPDQALAPVIGRRFAALTVLEQRLEEVTGGPIPPAF